MTVTKNIYLNNITESVYSGASITSNSITIDYNANGSTVLISGAISANFSCAISNVPTLNPTSSYGRACVVTLIMTNNSSTYYCNAVTVNGTAATEYFNGGAITTITSPAVVVQQLAIYSTGSSTYYVLANVSSFKAVV